MYLFDLIIKPNTHCNNTMCIEDIKPYMLTNEYKQNNLHTITPFIEIPIKNTEIPIKQKLEIIYPKQKDTLFWCIYIAGNNYNDYLNINRNYGVQELEIKYKTHEFIKNNTHKLKNTNIKFTKILIQEVLSELITNINNTSFQSAIALITYFNINIIIIDPTEKIFLELKSNEDETIPTYLLKKDKYGKYSIDLNILIMEQIANIQTNKIKLVSYQTPLKPMSGYKLDEIKNMMNILGLETSNMNKTEMYVILIQNVKCI